MTDLFSPVDVIVVVDVVFAIVGVHVVMCVIDVGSVCCVVDCVFGVACGLLLIVGWQLLIVCCVV